MRSLAAAVGLALAAAACNPAPEPDRPVHVVLLLIDTLRADRLGAYGYSRPTSPEIDAIAAESVVFTWAHAAAPWTLPSAVSLMTSRHPCEHGVLRDGQRVATDLPTLAEHLQAAGFASHSFFTNPYAGPFSGLQRGFDATTSAQQITGPDVAGWLDRRDPTHPFFLYIHNSEPHDPYEQPAATQDLVAPVAVEEAERINALLDRYRALGRADWDRRQPIGTRDDTAAQREVAAQLAAVATRIDDLYDGAVRSADQRVGEIADALRTRGLWDDTLFVLLSDHGEEFGEHGGWQHDQSVYEELLRVPLIVKLPRGEGAGRRIDTPVSLLDVAPTVLDVVGGVDRTASQRGHSLLPLVRDGAQAGDDVRIGGMRDNRKKSYPPPIAQRGDVNLTLRSGTTKGIYNAEPGQLELYDLALDPGERRDLSDERRALAAAWSELAREFLADCGGARPETGAALREGDAALLRRLGYLADPDEVAPGAPASRNPGAPADTAR